MLDCMVNYFGLDEDERPGYRRYICYHIVAGPGPTLGAGVASITTLAISDENERCTYCRHLHAVDTGGPAAALAKAIRYLDAYHGSDRVRRIQSAIRDLGGDPAAEAVLARSAPGPGANAPDWENDLTDAFVIPAPHE
jgi:hypothetical protein